MRVIKVNQYPKPIELQAALQKLDRNANPTWKAAVFEAIHATCLTYEFFTAQDVWSLLIEMHGEKLSFYGTTTKAALGITMITASRYGWCHGTKISMPREYKWENKHVGCINSQIWQSLLLGNLGGDLSGRFLQFVRVNASLAS